MPMAFVFVNAEVGSEDEALRQLRKIESVKEAYGIYGIYAIHDIVARVEVETTDRLREVITSKVRKLRWVRSTLTMMVIE